MSQNKRHLGLMHVQAADATHAIDVFFSNRKTLTLRVRADARVTVDAPLDTTIDEINEFVRRRSEWITEHQATARAYAAAFPPRRYATGETWRFLGQPYTLRVEPARRERVALSGGEIVVYARAAERVKPLLRNWYRRQAASHFPARMAAMAALVAPLGIDAPQTAIIRVMTSRWGTCSSDGRITLNLKLMQLDPALLDYVIVHELCHLREFNHSPRFYALLDAAMPGWEARRQALYETAMDF